MVFRFLFDMLKLERSLFFMRRGFLCLLFALLWGKVDAQYEFPSPPAQTQTITTGSLIIPMDTILQAKPGYFNLKSYGLVNALLQNEIPVKWAIKKGKQKNGINSADFLIADGNATRVFPDTQIVITGAGTIYYYSGPFIIDSNWVDEALPIINSFGNNVVVHKLTVNTTIDIRYTLTFKPLVALINSNGYDSVTVNEMQEAGISSSSYKLTLPAGTVFNESTIYSLLSDAHYTGGDTTHINPIYRYVQKGANYIAHCSAIAAFENKTFVMTTGGIDTAGSVSSYVFANHDLPISQFQGTLFNPWGEFKWWKPKVGSTFRTTTAYDVITRGVNARVLSGTKLKPLSEKGGNIYYLPGHDFYFHTATPYSPNDNVKINGRRIFLNSMFIPPSDTFGLDFHTAIKLEMSCSAGFPVKDENFIFYMVLSSSAYRAKNINVQLPIPAGLSYVTHAVPNGNFNPVTGVWSLDSIMRGEVDTLVLTVKINQLGTITYYGTAINNSLETLKSDNIDSISIFAVSRPVAVNDTNVFLGPYAVDTDTRFNDSDEDGGPFSNTSIINGPFNGNALMIGNDTIRYIPNASYTGPDSLQYLTCDNYPLCDTAWLFINVVSPLPVELSVFKGSRINGLVQLQWTTLSESDNDYFAIEQSIEGKYFALSGKVKGAGTSSILQEYHFMEIDKGEPMLYYRLRQIDFNGRSELSPVIALPIRTEAGLSLNLYPNPVNNNNEFVIHMEGLPAGEDLLRITDITGRGIFEKIIKPENESSWSEIINTSNYLEAGCYIVSLITNNNVIASRLVVK